MGSIPLFQLNLFRNGIEKKPDISKLKWENKVKFDLKIENSKYMIIVYFAYKSNIHAIFLLETNKITFSFVQEQNFSKASCFLLEFSNIM